MAKVLYIEADTNDADYITKETKIDKYSEECLPTVLKVAKVISQFSKDYPNKYNWPAHECASTVLEEQYSSLTEEEIQIFGDFCPYGEYGIHTIESIEIRETVVLEKLL